jgi:hypothetical protein
VITATPFSSPGVPTAAVRLDLSIEDTGGVPDCTAFVIERRTMFPLCGNAVRVECIPRQSGTRVLQFFDSVSPNTSYRYEVVGYSGPAGICLFPSDPFAFQQAFDPHTWAFPIIVYTTVGPDPTPVAQGTLIDPVDASATFQIASCPDGCSGNGWQGYGAAAAPYINSGANVWVYGTIDYCCNCCGWLIGATQVTPHDCLTIATETQAWGQVKRLYH